MPLGSSSSSSNGVNVSGSRLSSKNLSRQGGEDGAIDIAKAFDMSSFEDMDPSTSDGSVVIYDREVPFELRVQGSENSPQQVGTLEAIKVKILRLGDEENPTRIRVELSSEADLFFSYSQVVDERRFFKLQEQQRLTIDFNSFTDVLIRMLNACVKEPRDHLAVLVLKYDESAHLEFIKRMELKFVELLSLEFARDTEETIQQHITYRYNSTKQRLALMQSRLQDLANLVKLKQPSLLAAFARP